MRIISREKAKSLGLVSYFTGKLCKNRHKSDRFVNGGCCRQCMHEARKRVLKEGRFNPNNVTENSIARAKRLGVNVPLSRDDIEKMRAIYKESFDISFKSGVKHHVDHIWPLSRGGVHHPVNMQIITQHENNVKHAKHDGVSGVSYEDFMLAVSAYA